MKVILYIVMLSHITYAQVNCHTMSINSKRLIMTFKTEHLDSTKFVLKKWRANCGNLESIERLEILLNLREGKDQKSEIRSYTQRFIINNVLDLKKFKYPDNYFDQWTRKLAKNLSSNFKTFSFPKGFCETLMGDSKELKRKYIREKDVIKNEKSINKYEKIVFFGLGVYKDFNSSKLFSNTYKIQFSMDAFFYDISPWSASIRGYFRSFTYQNSILIKPNKKEYKKKFKNNLGYGFTMKYPLLINLNSTFSIYAGGEVDYFVFEDIENEITSSSILFGLQFKYLDRYSISFERAFYSQPKEIKTKYNFDKYSLGINIHFYPE